MLGRHFPAKILLVLLLLGGLAAAAGPVGAQNPIPELFQPESGAAAAAGVNPLALRGRAAAMNLGLVDGAQRALAAGQPAPALGLGLFADTHLVARFERTEAARGGGYSLAGSIEGSPASEIHLSVTQGAFFASINTGQALYRISAPDGRHSQIIQLDPARFSPEEELVPTPSAAAPAQPAAQAGPSSVDDGSRIDVYVGYTTAAKNAAGGQATILSLINTAISETNTGYANSSVQQRVVLVGADEYAYNEAGFSWNATLDRWQDPNDSVFGPAHILREIHQADEMVLLVSDPAYCGMAYLMTTPSTSFASNAFALVNQDCATGYYSFAHEMGHNMGAHHNRQDAGGAGAYDYAYGFWIKNPANNDLYDWRTIMAYGAPSMFGATLRVNHWSNPNINYNGQPTGLDIADPASAYNALALNNTAPYVAQFRDGAAPAAPTGLRCTPLTAHSVRLDWNATGSDLWQFHIERASAAAEDWEEIANLPATEHSYTDAASVNGLRYRVLADNGNGRAVSNPITFSFAGPDNLAVTPLSPYTARLDWNNKSTLPNALVVQRALAGSTGWVPLASLPATAVSYTDASVPDEQGYQYQVVAFYSGGSVLSNTAALPAFPSAPAGLTLSGLAGGLVQLDWSLAAGTQESLVIERRPLNGVFSAVGSTTPGAFRYVDPTLPATGDFQYRVVARNARADRPSAVTTLPAAPTHLHPVYPGSANSIQLAWNDNSTVETGYTVEVSSNAGASWAVESNPAAGAGAYLDQTGSCNQTRLYRLRAVAAASQSAAIQTSGVTPPCQPLPGANAGSRTILLSWPAAGAGVTFNIYYFDAGSTFVLLTPTGLPANSTTYFIGRLQPRLGYIFRVEAVNAAGRITSNDIFVTTLKQDFLFPLFAR